ncbi:MAG: hypothetical protein ACUVQ8_07525 [Nitrososphaeria archaeon]
MGLQCTRTEGYPVSYTEGPTALIAEPYIAEEYKWSGFNVVSRANNHCLDWGIDDALVTSIEGMRSTEALI